MDAEMHMLAYWVEDKGIETAFTEYYPELAQHDREIKQALWNLRSAEHILMQRVRYLTERAQEALDDDLPKH